MGNKTYFALIGSLALVGAAKADITFWTGNNITDFENVLFNDPSLTTTGPVVEGIGNVSASIIEFFGAGEDLVGSGGSATLSAVDGAFRDLTIDMQSPLIALVQFQFTMVVSGSGTATVTAHSTKGGSSFQDFAVSGSNNTIGMIATSPDYIDYLTISTDVDVTQMRQNRMVVEQVVPEPGTFLALGVGVALLAARRRKRL